MPNSSSFLRQLSSRETSSACKPTSSSSSSSSKRWSCSLIKQMEGLNGVNGLMMRKRVMVVVDQTCYSKHAMMWALTHLANKGDLLTLLHIINQEEAQSPYLANSLGSLCKACKPEVEVEALVIQGPKLATVMSQVKKLEVSVLVLGQKKTSPLITCLCGSSSSEKLVDLCIENADCLTIGVAKQSKGTGGYLISTRWQKNFWLLA